MPDEQKDFDAELPPIATMLQPDKLSLIADHARRAAELARRTAANGATGEQADIMLRHAVTMEAVAELLEVLRVPAINTTVAALLALAPDMQGIVSGAAVQLLEAGPRRHRLVLELRAVLEKTS